MPNEILSKPKTPLVWKASGGDKTMTFAPGGAGIADGAGRMGQKADFGAVYPGRYAAALKTRFATAPTAGNVVRVYWAASHDDAAFPAGVSGADATLPAAGRTLADDERQLELIGSLVATADTNAQYAVVGVFQPPTRYGAPVIVNASGQGLSNTEGDHSLHLYPVTDEIQ